MVVVGCGLSSDYGTTPVNIVQLCTGLVCGNYVEFQVHFLWFWTLTLKYLDQTEQESFNEEKGAKYASHCS